MTRAERRRIERSVGYRGKKSTRAAKRERNNRWREWARQRKQEVAHA